MTKNWRFEYLFAILIVVVLAGALSWSFILKDKELIMPALMALIATLSAITAFMFTKHVPGPTPEPPVQAASQLLSTPLSAYEWPQPDQAPTQKPQPPPTADTSTATATGTDTSASNDPTK